MIVTTTQSIEGMRILEYKGIVCGEVISGVNFVRDIAASFTNFLGGRSASYEDELIDARQNALAEMQERAAALGANAVVGRRPGRQRRGGGGHRLRGPGRRQRDADGHGQRHRRGDGLNTGKTQGAGRDASPARRKEIERE